MHRFFRLALLALLLASCSTQQTTTTGDGTAVVPGNAIKISLAYSPEKENWLKERFAAFQATNPKLGGRPIVVEGINKSSGAARTEMVRAASSRRSGRPRRRPGWRS